MKKGKNNRVNPIYVCCAAAAALVYIVSTARAPQTGDAAGNPTQVIENIEEADIYRESSTAGTSGVESGNAGGLSTDSGNAPAAGSAGDPAGAQPERPPESAEAILESSPSAQWAETSGEQLYTFRNQRLLDQHFEKHGEEMGFSTVEEYVAAANAVINHPDVLHKQEAEDNDDVYFLEATNEFVVVSTDGYIRTYFIASGGIDYYNRQ